MNVETPVVEQVIREGQGNASIEPRSYERGNTALVLGSASAAEALQLSHVLMNVETLDQPRPVLWLCAASRFN